MVGNFQTLLNLLINCQKVFDNVPKDEQVVIEADYKAGWDSATGQSVFYISLL